MRVLLRRQCPCRCDAANRKRIIAAATEQCCRGAQVRTIKPGDGKTFPKAGQMVKAHYTGKLQDGTVFDTSKKFLGGIGGIGAFEFQIGAGDVIKGWDVGMLKMSLGETAELTVGPSFGYGARTSPYRAASATAEPCLHAFRVFASCRRVALTLAWLAAGRRRG